MSQSISISLREDVAAALAFLAARWYPGENAKRNATIQRAIIQCAKREGFPNG